MPSRADPRTNRLWVQDDQAHIKKMRTLIRQLDIPVAQVLIKARIVSVDDHSLQSLGVIFGTRPPASSDGLSMDLPSTSIRAGVADIPVARLKNGQFLDLELTALEQEGHATVMSRPTLLVCNHQTATIESGEAVPYQEKTGLKTTQSRVKSHVGIEVYYARTIRHSDSSADHSGLSRCKNTGESTVCRRDGARSDGGRIW